jgi:hypothetical protein
MLRCRLRPLWLLQGTLINSPSAIWRSQTLRHPAGLAQRPVLPLCQHDAALDQAAHTAITVGCQHGFRGFGCCSCLCHVTKLMMLCYIAPLAATFASCICPCPWCPVQYCQGLPFERIFFNVAVIPELDLKSQHIVLTFCSETITRALCGGAHTVSNLLLYSACERARLAAHPIYLLEF